MEILIVFTDKKDVDKLIFDNIVSFLEKSKGFKITSKGRLYDVDPGERDFFPTINFDFNLK